MLARLTLSVSVVLVGICTSAFGSINLPAPGPGTSLTFGDFNVFSLAALQSALEGQPKAPGGQDVFAIGGHNADDVIIISSNSGTNFLDNGAGISPAFEAVSPNPATTDTYSETRNWTATTAALRAAIDTAAGESFVAWFNFNETNPNNVSGLLGQDLLAWAKIVLEHESDSNLDLEFYVRGGNPVPQEIPGWVDPGNTPTEPIANLNALGFDATDPEWAYVHGQITVAADGSLLHLGEKITSGPNQDPADSDDISQDLGINQASFGIYNKLLSDLILDENSGYDLFRVESLLLSHIDDGKEQVFIRGAIVGGSIDDLVPEPFSLLVWGGLFGCALCRRRRNSRA